MTRRRLLFACIALAPCLGQVGLATAADVQQPGAPRRIGFSPQGKEAQAFREGLRDAGYAAGGDVVIACRSTNGDYARVPELIADLVRSRVEVIVVDSTVATQVVKPATSTIPIVMVIGADPVGSGLVASLARLWS